MRFISTAFLLFVSIILYAQSNLTGRYRDYFGSRILLNSDNTFKYTWHFDMQSSWTTGTWTVMNDTVVFHMIPVYDTLQHTNQNNFVVDTLILSPDERVERISSVDTRILLSYGQNSYSHPGKLFFRKGRLYKISNGRLVKKKQKGFWTGKKWIPWYFKSND